MGLKKEYAFEFQGNSHPSEDDTIEIGPHVHEPDQESEQREHEREHGIERERPPPHAHAHAHTHSREHDRHDHHNPHSLHQEEQHHEHHDHIHIHHTKSIGHHKKPGYSAGSGLRSIAQGSADQASSAVSNQVRHIIIILLSILCQKYTHSMGANFIAQFFIKFLWSFAACRSKTSSIHCTKYTCTGRGNMF